MKRTIFFAIACSMCLPIERAHALSDQWFFGIGGGASLLQPNPELPGLGVDDRQGTGGNVFFGKDLDDRSSGQLTLYSLGEARLDNDEDVPFYAADASVLYRIYDSKDARISRGGISVALYGRFALGFLERDTDEPLSDDASVYFGAGGGAEVFVTNNLSMRFEGMYHDESASSGSVQLVARFGGTQRAGFRPTPRPAIPEPESSTSLPAEPAVATPTVPSVPPTVTTPAAPTAVVPIPAVPSGQDADGDGVPNAQDQCPGSSLGYPVRANGCALFDGVLSGVSFVAGTAELSPGATNQLDFLANVLGQYPQARVELHSHTDDQGTVREQAILTRARLRTLGTYLVSKGIRSNRLVLRSFGGTRPLYDNASVDGRANNNRIEVIENRPQ